MVPAESADARPGIALLLVLLTCTALAAACGKPPELRDPPRRVAPPPTSPAAGIPTLTPPNPGTTAGQTGTTAPSRSESIAVDCAGQPSGDQVIMLVRRTDGMLPSGARVVVAAAPRCAGRWQYTVIQISDREPLHVVTEGWPAALTLVTAGTDVCTIPVRIGAPPGIRDLACGSAPIPTSGP